jgi:hypothetical protein
MHIRLRANQCCFIPVGPSLQQGIVLQMSDLVQVSALVGTKKEEFVRPMHLDRLPTVRMPCSRPNIEETSESGELSFPGNGDATIRMPLLPTGSSCSRVLQDHAHCYELLGQLRPDFMFSLTAGMTDPKCSFHIGKAHAEKIPLFLDLVNAAREASTDASIQPQAIDGSANEHECMNQAVSARTNVFTAPFEPPPPASASGLAFLLMLLDEAASPLQLFSSPLCGPRLAIQCLSVRPAS